MTPTISRWTDDLLAALDVTAATTVGYLRRLSRYKIQLIRWPLGPIFTFATWRVMYGASGRSTVNGATLSGFLVTGVFGAILLSSSIWTSGYAIEWERDEGTSGSLFLSPASRSGVIAGYAVGALIWFLPSFLVLVLMGAVSGAALNAVDPLAVCLSVVLMIAGSTSMGFALASLFILSRRGNLIANAIQPPLTLLAGFAVPVTRLPGWTQPISNALPITHALEALRTTALDRGSLSAAGPELLLTALTSTAFIIVGMVSLKRMEHVARGLGQLDLY